MNKRLITLFYMIIVCVLLSSCATKSLWKKHEYPEVFRQYLATENNDNIVIIGEKYHYILKADDELKNILEWKDRDILNINFYKVNVAGDDTITGSYNISVLYSKLSPEQRDWLKSNGFQFNTKEKMYTLYLYYKAKIKGRRYQVENSETSGKKLPISFAKNSTIGIRQDFSNLEKVPRLLASPVTMAFDGTVVMGMILLSPYTPHNSYMPQTYKK